jgi:lysylphosphatidylglycerol synthetase-like protein (DUF2156 family)
MTFRVDNPKAWGLRRVPIGTLLGMLAIALVAATAYGDKPTREEVVAYVNLTNAQVGAAVFDNARGLSDARKRELTNAAWRFQLKMTVVAFLNSFAFPSCLLLAIPLVAIATRAAGWRRKRALPDTRDRMQFSLSTMLLLITIIGAFIGVALLSLTGAYSPSNVRVLLESAIKSKAWPAYVVLRVEADTWKAEAKSADRLKETWEFSQGKLHRAAGPPTKCELPLG